MSIKFFQPPKNKQSLITNLLVLFILAFVCFPLHYERMFHSVDGFYYYLLAQMEWKWMPFGFGFGLNLFQGMGSTFPAINALLIPVILLQLLFNSGHLTHILTYALFSIELFLSAYLLSRL